MATTESEIHLYWATGCTSCLNAKEFLERNEVDFVSHNIINDRAKLDDLEAIGLPRNVPWVIKGTEWANGQILSDVADLVGIEHAAEPLPVDDLKDRLDTILDAAYRFLHEIPEDELDTDIPNRPRSYAELVYHIFGIPDSFLEHEDGIPLKSWKSTVPWDDYSTEVLAEYATDVQTRLDAYFDGPAQDRDWSTGADVYYGEPTVHELFERVTWHSGQHTRQLEWILENELGIEAVDTPGQETWDGLPMPEKVWDA